jgi:hypothetical protein
VLLINYESKERVQQMFSDLNRFVVAPPPFPLALIGTLADHAEANDTPTILVGRLLQEFTAPSVRLVS